MSSVNWLRSTLDIAGAEYTEMHHPIAYTAQQIAELEHVSGNRVAKTVAVRVDNRVLLLVLPAPRQVSLGRVKDILGAKSARLLTETEMSFEFPDCEIGAVPPFRHWPHVDIWVDSELGKQKNLIFAGGNHRDAIKMPYSEWFHLASPREESFSIYPEESYAA